MRPVGVVLDTPLFNQLLGMTHGDEPVLVQAFIAEAPVEALDIGTLHRLARPNERQRDTGFVGPSIQHLTSERQPGLEWGISNSDSGKNTRWQNLWLRDYQSMNAPQDSAPVIGTAHHFVVIVTSAQTGALYQDGVLLSSGGLGAPTIQGVLQIGTMAGSSAR